MNTPTADIAQTPATHPKAELMKLMIGNWVSQSIYAAARLGVVDALGDQAMDVPTLAGHVAAQPNELRRLLRALESVGLFHTLGDDCYKVTEVGKFLRSDRKDSLRPLALFNGEALYEAWRALPYAVQTGRSAFEYVHGAPIFDYLAADADAGAQFDRMVTTVHGAESAGVVDSFDFSKFATVVDVGGGKGSFIAEILDRNPGVHGIVYDLPHVVLRAREYLVARSLGDRCDTVAGSFFESVPPDADAYLLRHVIHDWADPEASKILARCRAAMHPGARLFIVEAVIPEGPAAWSAKMLDLNMLVICAGQERTVAEFQHLLAQSDLRLEAVHPTRSPRVSLIEASALA